MLDFIFSLSKRIKIRSGGWHCIDNDDKRTEIKTCYQIYVFFSFLRCDNMSTLSCPKLKIFRTIWGAESQFSSDIHVLFNELHRLGFDGIEASLLDMHRLSNNDDQVFMQALAKNQLELIAICYTNWADFVPGSWQDLTVDQHLENLSRELDQVMKYNPVHINIHGGQDNWSLEEHERFFQEALKLQAKYPHVSSSHEVRFS